MPWELDDAQREAVESPDRAVMVVAGPGTGKTRVLTARVVWLTEAEKIDPSRIRAITYTNRATAEMRSRLASRSSPASEVAVSTFHSWAYRLVRKYASALGFDREPVVFDEDAQEHLLLKILAEKRIPEEAMPIRYLKQRLDRVKADIACPLMDDRFDFEHYDTIADIFRTYQRELTIRNALDFADILLTALRILYIHPDIRHEIVDSLDHLLIDEFQDINPAQYRLIDALDHPALNLFAVGDEDQTIYGFRGSSGVFIDQFVADFGAKLIPLGASYRCSKGILFAAGTVISKNRRFYQQAPHPPEGIREKPPIGIFELEDEEEEAKVVTKLIRSWAESGIPYRDMAILYRVHYLADECERILIQSGIPTLRLLPDRQRDEVAGDLLPLLRLAAQDTEWDWDRAIGLPRDRLGELDDLRVRLAAIADNVPLFQLLGRPSRFRKLSGLARWQLARLNRFVRELRSKSAIEAPSSLINMVADHLHKSSSPWTSDEDYWIEYEGNLLDGFDKLSIGAILEKWRSEGKGIRIFHGPTISSAIAARILEYACTMILGIGVEKIPLPAKIDADTKFPLDLRPAVVIGHDIAPARLFPVGTMLPDALYLTKSGISANPASDSNTAERFNYALAAHRLSSLLVGYRPGGGEEEILIFFDLETTGTDIRRSEIIEIAALKVLLKEGSIHELGNFVALVKPASPIPPGAEAVHGITDSDVADAQPLENILPRFLDFIADSPLAGHNIDEFDLPILRRDAAKILSRPVNNLTLDTLAMARRMFPGEPHRLGVLAEKFGIDAGTAHRALNDVRTNVAVFNKMIALDESLRTRAFAHDLPISLAVAHAVEDYPDTDPSIIRKAAARQLSGYDGPIDKYPYLRSLAETLSDKGLSRVAVILTGLAREHVEWSTEDRMLRSRIDLLRSEALSLEDELPDATLTEYLAHIALLTEGDFDSEEDAVRMMTLHAAKGLEFDRVIILGMEQGNLPHRLALGKTMAEIEEERRLCYVGITRARKKVALIYTRRRSGYWKSPSMFLSELPRNSYKKFKSKDRLKDE